MSEQAVERSRYMIEIERFDEQPRVPDLAAAACSHEATQLLLDGAIVLGRLLLHDPERAEITLGLDHGFDRGGAERADQLVLEIENAHVEADGLHSGTVQVRPEAGSLETADEVAFLADVAEAGETDVDTIGSEQTHELGNRLGAADRHDGDAVCRQAAPAALGQDLDRDSIADAFDEHDPAQSVAGGERELGSGKKRRVRTASSALDDRRQEPPSVKIHASSIAAGADLCGTAPRRSPTVASGRVEDVTTSGPIG